MAISTRRTATRKALVSLSAVALAATMLGASAPIASAAISKTPTRVTSLLDDPAAWAAVKEAAATGYAVPAALAASCGARQ